MFYWNVFIMNRDDPSDHSQSNYWIKWNNETITLAGTKNNAFAQFPLNGC